MNRNLKTMLAEIRFINDAVDAGEVRGANPVTAGFDVGAFTQQVAAPASEILRAQREWVEVQNRLSALAH